jgi:hypothetical protein
MNPRFAIIGMAAVLLPGMAGTVLAADMDCGGINEQLAIVGQAGASGSAASSLGDIDLSPASIPTLANVAQIPDVGQAGASGSAATSLEALADRMAGQTPPSSDLRQLASLVGQAGASGSAASSLEGITLSPRNMPAAIAQLDDVGQAGASGSAATSLEDIEPAAGSVTTTDIGRGVSGQKCR